MVMGSIATRPEEVDQIVREKYGKIDRGNATDQEA